MTDKPTVAAVTEETAPEPTPPPQPVVSPGQMIREGREAAGLSAEDFATQIKLSRSTLEALEADNFAVLSEPVYVRGYYRRCAKVLNLSEAKLIAAYEDRAKPKAPTVPNKIPLADDVVVSGRRGGFRMVLGILLVIVALIAVAWYLQRQPAGSGTISQPAVVAPTVEPPPAQTPPVGERNSPLADRFDTNLSGLDREPAPADAAPETAAPPPAESAPVEAKPEPVAAVPAAGAPIHVRFTDNSWVRIEDADGKSLLAGLSRRGEEHELRGKPPYTLFFGYAPGVELTLDGKPVDLKPYTSAESNTARLTLPRRN